MSQDDSEAMPGDRSDAPDSPQGGEESKVERLLRPLVEDTMLWPISFVMLAHAVAFMTPVVVLGVRERRPAFLLALSLLIMMTGKRLFDELRRGRIGVIGGALIALWTMTSLAAWLTSHYGIL